jgi:glycerol uptake facilitator protein
VNHEQPSLVKKCLAEFLGTYLLILFGCGAVHASVLTGAQSGLWQVAIVWGIAIMLAVYTVGAVSGAHINPAITLAFAVWGRFPRRSVLPYILAQLTGAFLAAATLFVLFNPYLKAREQEKHVVRGSPGSEITAMCYGEYFPSPGPLFNAEGPYSVDAHQRLNVLVSEPTAFLAELLGTLVLAMVVFAVTDERNSEAPPGGLAPVFIGLTVSALISVIAPLTPGVFQPSTGLWTEALCVPRRLGIDRPAGDSWLRIPHRLHHRPDPGCDHRLRSLRPRPQNSEPGR